MAIIRLIHKISDILFKIGEYLSMIMVAAMVIITDAQIICRVFFTALTWSEEATRYLLVWSTFIGASCVYKMAGHISVTVIQDLFPEKVKKWLKLLVHVLCGIFFVLMVIYGFKYCGKMSAQTSPAMKLPMNYMYASIAVGGVLLTVHCLDAILQSLFAEEEKELSEGETAQ